MRIHRVFFAAGILSFGGLPSVTSGQGDDAGHEPALIDVSFKGGTATEYVEAIKKAAGRANIVLMPEAAGVSIPAVQLSNTSVESAAFLLDDRIEQSADGRIVLKVEMVPISTTGEEPTYRIAGHTAGVEVEASIWGVSDIFASGSGLERADLLAAVETTLEVIDDTSVEPVIRFHEATDLLIIRGTERQREAVEHVLEELRRQNIERQHSQTEELRRSSNDAHAAALQMQDEMRMVQMREQEAIQRAVSMDVEAERIRVRAESLQAMLDQRQENAALRQEIENLRAHTRTLQDQINAEHADRSAGSQPPR